MDYIAESLRPLAVKINTLGYMRDNPRKHGDRSIKALKQSLQEFGQLKPVVLASDGVSVIAGNGQLEAAQALGWTHLAVVKSTLDGQRAQAFAIADNRTQELSEFDQDVVSAIMADLDKDLALATGFIDSIFEDDEPEPPAEVEFGPETTPSSEIPQSGASPVGGPSIQRPASGPAAGGETEHTVRIPSIRYDIVFGGVDEQQVFYGFVRFLKEKYPDIETVGGRILEYVRSSETDFTEEQ